MKEFLKISLAQYDIEWENPQANLEFLDDLLENHQSDLIILPEMFTTGFSMNVKQIAEKPFGKSYQWMKSVAEKGNCAVSGSISTIENGKFYNRFYFVTPENTTVYDKKHLFGYGKETEAYSSGNEIVSVEFRGWKFRLITCYDVRFPVWCRNTDDYDALICVANWPAVRVEPWKALLKARAIENMAYTIGVNRIGTDDYDLVYNGNSKVFDPIGTELKPKIKNKHLLQTEISLQTVKDYRKNFGFLKDKDEFTLIS
ncbi:nitrilase-related carbon-nitrogen hydrolase [Moheibacter lacus]|uniref:Omega-amidase YafV n=1 Tax=Moheibacter lacus TaxID=2745851 RepID=A0A838ZR74_9FLAO|nr:nitrilase-related carbon-nitrogen hydrolase [Moheibacter lacus]MBA5628822.1 nitrilase family protein [Moheibacter lacus]